MKSYALATLFVLVSTVSCTSLIEKAQADKKGSSQQNELILKQHFSESFEIGTAISADQILGNTELDDLAIVRRHFNSFTPENAMKWESIHPRPEQFEFSISDALVDFGMEKNINVVGHTLVWHSQTPDWVFENGAGERTSRDVLLERMKNHIHTVAGRYAGKIFAWDVVNEALNEDGTYRQSPWFEIIGEEFIYYAFKFAQESAPNAKLYYNDYNLFKPAKRKGAIRIAKMLQEKGIRIDGIGIQGHYALDYPNLTMTEDSIIAFSKLGVDVPITELDVSVLEFPDEDNQGADVSLNIELSAKFNPYSEALPRSVHEQLGFRYKQIFEVLRRHQDKISRVTFWGVHDQQSWRNDWPMKGRTDYPLLIDRNGDVKDFVSSL
ncbi:endo-1,4-beta-xylanase [Alteromonas oceanisediminis]|uniref:endo-1,4-beta-xylanase n=1 Tax=Alteromonas oceanisediminis TaxID=2836180 RepID=UPI001BD95495|nr:endo-1,4-beta-xylanase [Alteromonas oceanisediminis]MBT0586289.1 endo-1,4-beta-xylanase [Alteromonas oceanisediminis]